MATFIGEDERFAYKRAAGCRICVGRGGARMVEAATFVAVAVGDAGRRAIFYRVDRSSELRWGWSDGGR